MRILKNEKLIKRNGRIGQITSLTGLLVLAAGMFISFKSQELISLAWVCLLIGFVLSQVGLYFGNRWGRRPRPDELIDDALKGFDDRHTLYHYQSPASHLLLGPSGLWVFIPRNLGGKITYEKNRWKQRGGGFFQAYLRFFGQEGIGRPDLDIETEVDALKRFLKKKQPDLEIPNIQAAVVITNDQAEIDADNAPTPTLSAKKLKELVRKNAKEKGLSPTKVEQIQGALDG